MEVHGRLGQRDGVVAREGKLEVGFLGLCAVGISRDDLSAPADARIEAAGIYRIKVGGAGTTE